MFKRINKAPAFLALCQEYGAVGEIEDENPNHGAGSNCPIEFCDQCRRVNETRSEGGLLD